MKLGIFLFSLLFANHAIAGSIGSESMFLLGDTAVVFNPYYEEGDKKLPINIDPKWSNTLPDRMLCSMFTRVPLDQIEKAGIVVSMAGRGVSFDMGTESFSPTPPSPMSLIAISTLNCKTIGYPVTPLGGETTDLPNGSMKVDHPTVMLNDQEYPLVIAQNRAKELCLLMRYSDVEASMFSSEHRNPSIKAVFVDIPSEGSALNFTLTTTLRESKDEPFTLLDSITCKK